MTDKLSIKGQMVNDAILIVLSIEWIEKQLQKCLEDMDVADKNRDYEGLLKIEKRVNELIGKMEREDKNVTSFSVKYKNYEEEKKLSTFTKVKQTSNGRLPTDKRGKNSGGNV